MNIFRDGNPMLPFNKFKDTLSTSDLYEKEFRHRRSDFHVNGIDHGRVWLTVASGRIGRKVKLTDNHTDKLVCNHFPMVDYIHSPSEANKIVYQPATPDVLMPGYKIKIR